jgi:hypothetical protein
VVGQFIIGKEGPWLDLRFHGWVIFLERKKAKCFYKVAWNKNVATAKTANDILVFHKPCTNLGSFLLLFADPAAEKSQLHRTGLTGSYSKPFNS